VKINWPRPAIRRARAEANNSSWMLKSHQLGPEQAHLRNVNNWLAGYEAAMRDARDALSRGEKHG
jgi:hypothetical protein